MRHNTVSEKGKFKEEIQTALYKNPNIKELLLGDTTGMSAPKIMSDFREHVNSHLFIDDTIKETASYIFYDVDFPRLGNHIKDCRVIMYAICHRDILDDYHKEGYWGNRADILAQMIEDTLVNDEEVSNNFGIGELSLDSVTIYNSYGFYGNILTFNIPSFRYSNGKN